MGLMSSFIETSKRYINVIANQFDLSVDGHDSPVSQYASASTHTTYDGGSIRDLVPFRLYDTETDLYLNDNSYGFIFELAPMVGATDEMVQILSKSLAAQLPEKAWVTIMDYASNRVGGQLNTWKGPREGHDTLIEKVAKYRVGHLEKGIYGSLYDKLNLRLFDYRVLVTVSLEGKPSQRDIDTLLGIRDALSASFHQAYIDNILVKPEQLLAFTREILGNNGETTRPEVQYNPYEMLNTQAVEDNQKIRVRPGRLVINEGTGSATDVRVLSISKRKRIWPQWENQRLIGDMYNDAQRLTCPTLFVTAFQVLKQDSAQNKILTQALSANKKAEQRGFVANLTPHTKQQAQELNFVAAKLNDGEKLVQMYQHVVIFAPDGKGNTCEQQIKGIYDSCGWKLSRVPFLQLQSLLVCLPFTLAEGLGQDLHSMKRLKQQLCWSIANLAQMQGEWKGDDWSHPLMMMIGRRGQPLNFNPFLNNDGNFNVAVVGKSGSGKSVFMNELSYAVLGIGGRDYTIDIGGSYRHACHLFGGTYIDVDHELSLNPFSNLGPAPGAPSSEVAEYWAEVKAMISSIIMSMCRQKSDASDFEESVILTVTADVIEKYKQETTFTLIYDHFVALAATDDANGKSTIPEQSRATLYEIAAMIKPYTLHGEYGKYFSGQCNVNFNNRYVVLETEKFESMGKRMMQVVIKLLMYHITEALYHGDRKTPTLIKIDEGWKMLDSRDATFIEDASRRVRKYQGSLVTGTQSVGDYFKNPAAKACWEQSDYTVMLSQKSESIAEYKRQTVSDVDSHFERLLKSVKRNGEYYSEALIIAPNGVKAVGRLILDPYSVSAFSTKGPDYSRVTWLDKQLNNMEQALDIRMTERELIEKGMSDSDARLEALFQHLPEAQARELAQLTILEYKEQPKVPDDTELMETA
ncbi:type IV secretion system protein TraC [Enterovibrio paralichthyis]|uniref:type IV secretion system protein TraC n=1 Tax=Enterovibrio paralichthyis TaxID=2853805 RepID=UPI001C47EE66|nr:type IV secretion system protein TraC [Enterovibrio paralichthyis]MBV7300272.1 type IV secretion system protein TraC [Enterovibrio paralichthyis]